MTKKGRLCRDTKTMKSFKYNFLFLVAFCQCDWFTFLMRTEQRLVAVHFVNKKIYISCSWSCMLMFLTSSWNIRPVSWLCNVYWSECRKLYSCHTECSVSLFQGSKLTGQQISRWLQGAQVSHILNPLFSKSNK